MRHLSPDRRSRRVGTLHLLAVVAGLVHGSDAPAQPQRSSWSFAFGNGVASDGVVRVSATDVYSKDRGFGFEFGSAVTISESGVATSAKPFYFSAAVPEGNYRIRLTLGDPNGESATTVKAELRRLMVESAMSKQGAITRTVIVNVRTPRIATGGEVRLKDRERTAEAWAWDEKLTLEFNGPRPCVSAISIERADDLPTVFLLGDSTVCDQPAEPFASWGQMLTCFFGPGVAVANHAESGESLRSSLGAKRLDKVLSLMKPGDWLLIQFGHNDMKAVDEAAYTSDLRRFVNASRAKGGRPVMLTPMHRRKFKDGAVVNSHRGFPDAARALAREENVPLIDLHAMSKVLYESLGPERSVVLFKSGDGTHHNNYGAYQLARCVVEGIRRNRLDLARFLADDAPTYDPARPDPPETFAVPASPSRSDRKPDGN